jgi:diguanylate cyclase (GGDEF)-like protein
MDRLLVVTDGLLPSGWCERGSASTQTWDVDVRWDAYDGVVFVVEHPVHAASLVTLLAEDARPSTVAVLVAGHPDAAAIAPLLARVDVDGFLDVRWPADLVDANVAIAVRHARFDRNVVEIQRVVLEQTRSDAASLYELAMHDDLTGLYTRRHFREVMELERARCRREERPYATIFVDVDDLRRINSVYGHAGGSKALRGLGRVLQSLLRGSDVAGRVGGDEFIVLLSNCDRAGGAAFADRLRERVASTAIPMGDRTLHFTVSVGVASYPEDGATPERVIERADRALYRAKQGGKNCTAMFGDGANEPTLDVPRVMNR